MTTLPAKALKRALPAALVVDDDAPLRSRLARALGARGFAAHEAGTVAEGLAQAKALRPALVVLDLRLPGGSGLDIVAELAALDPAPCVLLVSGYASIPLAVEAVKRGAADVLTKPADADQLVAAYERWKEGGADETADDALATPTLAQAEWDHIHRVLSDCGGNITQAAEKLGLHRRSLQRKLEKRR
jgi:two-component system response regulator RegA